MSKRHGYYILMVKPFSNITSGKSTTQRIKYSFI